MEAIILAGGKGTRLRSQVSELPKPMAQVGSRPFLEYLLDYWIAQGVRHFILSIGHLAPKVSDHFGESYRGATISYSRETEPLGTGGALLLALDQLQKKGPALLLNGDSFLEVPLDALLQFHLAKQSRFTLALRHVEKNSRYGSVPTDNGGRCVSMLADPEQPTRAAMINGGAYCIDPLFARSWKNPGTERMISLEKEMIPAWISRGEPIYGWDAGSESRFIDIGTPEDYARAKEFFGQVISKGERDGC